MFRCGITGYNGNLGKTFLRFNKKSKLLDEKVDLANVFDEVNN